MNTKSMRVISFILVLTLIISIVSVTVFADFVSDFSNPPLYLEQTADENAGTVTITVKTSDAFTFVGGKVTLKYDKDAFELTSSKITGAEGLNLTKNITANNEGATVTITTDENVEFAQNDVFLTFIFSKKSTIADGDYSFVLDVEEWANDSFGIDTFTNSLTESKTYTVVSDPSKVPYKPSIQLSSNIGETVLVGEELTLELRMNKDYAAMQMTITYDPEFVAFSSEKSTLVIGDDVNNKTLYVNDDGNGTLKLATYGADKTSADAYKLVFDANVDGEAAFTITEAKVGTGTSAQNANLETVTVAELPNQSDVVTIEKAPLTVTLNKYNDEVIFSGANSAQSGKAYTFTATDKNYDYENITVVMGNTDVTDSVTGGVANGWTVPNVTDNLVISGTRTPKNFDVTEITIEGETETEKALGQATYKSDYVFTIPADVDPTQSVGYKYTFEVYIDDVKYTNHTETQTANEYRIPGADITGDIKIEITKTEVPADTFEVDVTGDGAADITMDPETGIAETGDTVTLTLNRKPGYLYTLTVDGEEKQFTGENTYTITIGDADVAVVVTKTLDTSSAKQFEYLQVNGQKMYLVTIGTEQYIGQTYTYNNVNMLWSEQYGQYAVLVIEDENFAFDSNKFALINQAAEAVTYDKNVNDSDDTDANDAQFIWNMYNAKYTDFNTVTMEQFLSADLNNEKVADSLDALVIINFVLGKAETNS